MKEIQEHLKNKEILSDQDDTSPSLGTDSTRQKVRLHGLSMSQEYGLSVYEEQFSPTQKYVV